MVFIRKIANDNHGGTALVFSLLVAVMSYAYVVTTGSLDCLCLKQSPTDLMTLNNVERLVNSFLAFL